MIKVILKENVPGHGSKNDIVDVSEGFARNFLLPKNKAIIATPDSINKIDQEKKQASILAEKGKERNLELKNKIETLKLEIKKKAKEGKLFGGVNAREISDATGQVGIKLDPKQVVISSNINTVGAHKVTVKLDKSTQATLSIDVLAE